jgi:PIN domain nuclease of toxin-antitoxin system
MRVLVDTHALLWAGLAPANISKRPTAVLANRANEVIVSAASAWEIATKVRLGKLPEAATLERDFINSVQEAGYTLLPIEVSHALRAGRLAEVTMATPSAVSSPPRPSPKTSQS